MWDLKNILTAVGGVHVCSLKEGYSDRALCWDTLAQRHWVDIKHDALTGILQHCREIPC